MGDIEHWTLVECPDCGASWTHMAEQLAWCQANCKSDPTAVDVVRADAYRGAVEALEAVSAVIPAYWGKTGSNAQRRAYELLTAVLYPDATGGQ